MVSMKMTPSSPFLTVSTISSGCNRSCFLIFCLTALCRIRPSQKILCFYLFHTSLTFMLIHGNYCSIAFEYSSYHYRCEFNCPFPSDGLLGIYTVHYINSHTTQGGINNTCKNRYTKVDLENENW